MQFIHELPGRTHVAVVWKVGVEKSRLRMQLMTTAGMADERKRRGWESLDSKNIRHGTRRILTGA
jgi:hypothetical protein